MARDTSQEDLELMAERIRQSLESTDRALAAFVESLDRSGFKDSIPAYRQMYQVLLQQRLWAEGHSRGELQPLWESIAGHSDDLYNRMEAFANIMRDLRTINMVRSLPNGPEGESQRWEDEELLEVLSAPQFLPAGRISALLGMDKEHLRDRIEPLVSRGIIDKRGWGNGLSYRLRRR